MTTHTESKIKNIHIIINPASGKSEPILPIINETLKDSRIQWDVSVTKKDGDCERLAREWAKKKVNAILVYGGDGTIMEAVRGMLETDVPLGILPGGSGNVLATELGISKDLKEACNLIVDGPHIVRPVDIARFHKKYFITRSSLGLEAEFVKGAKRETKNRFGPLAYFLGLPHALKKSHLTRYDLMIDGKPHTVRGLTCIVTNCGGVGMGDLSLDKAINVSDGLIDVIIAKRADISAFARFFASLLKKELPHDRTLVRHFQGKDIAVIASRSQTLQCDGEVLGKGNTLTAKVIPNAIHVIVPPPVKEANEENGKNAENIGVSAT
jgi:diacylglycerol kinase (ATP)